MATPTADSYSAASGATVYAGRGTALPSWVPTTAWEWTSLGSTSVWSNYIKDDGTGVAADLSPTPRPPLDTTYSSLWNFCGTAYDQTNHEITHFGGGHAQSFINITTRWNLNQNTPSITVASAQTSASDRKTRFDAFVNTEYDNRQYFADGKPYSSHTYNNLQIVDGEIIVFGFGFMASPGTGGDGAGGGWGGDDIAGLPRGGAWRAESYYTDLPVTAFYGPRFTTQDGTTVYYWENNPPTQLRKWVRSNDMHTNVGASALTSFYSRQAEDGAGRALSLGSENTGGVWQAQYIDLATGTPTPVTVSGDSIPSGRGIYGLVWCPAQGYWLAVFFNNAALYPISGANAISAVTVATITPTGSDTATASVKTMTGADVPVACRAWHGLHFDPTFGVALLVTDLAQPVLAFKVN